LKPHSRFTSLKFSILLFAFLFASLMGACTTGRKSGEQGTKPENQLQSTTLTVFAAASLVEVFGAIARDFEAEHPGVSVVLNLAGSQQLAQQLVQGAPADVFASADRRQIEAIVLAKRIDARTPEEFARNRLVTIFPLENADRIENLQDLTTPGLRLVIVDPAQPIGAYTMQFLDQAAREAHLGEAFRNGFLANVASYEENVRAVLSKVVLGEADAGIVYATDYASAGEHDLQMMEIPDELNVTASYYLAPINDSQHEELAQSFVDFVLSSHGQAIFAKYGFLPVD
jgi:molybdate transport system substrate-binding protein